MLPSRIFVVFAVLCATIKGKDGASSSCRNAHPKGGETKECHRECLLKYDYISYDDVPEHNVPVCRGTCRWKTCWCLLNPALRIPNAPTRLNKMSFYTSSKANESHFFRLNFGTDASKARAKQMTPQALARIYGRELRRTNSGAGSNKGSSRGGA